MKNLPRSRFERGEWQRHSHPDRTRVVAFRPSGSQPSFGPKAPETVLPGRQSRWNTALRLEKARASEAGQKTELACPALQVVTEAGMGDADQGTRSLGQIPPMEVDDAELGCDVVNMGAGCGHTGAGLKGRHNSRNRAAPGG